MSGWKPEIDYSLDNNPLTVQKDFIECKALAEKASEGITQSTAEGAAVGSTLGALTGLVANTITGNSLGSGAGLGTVGGALTGGVYQGYEANKKFKHAYNACMRNRGHTVL